ncbi:transposase [Geobacter sp.]|uniref:transposase n=1 Tax=Geobacter sp. TaxID=46610 RepID=UPI00262D6DC4|nr:transposase [Geobacter sp.]
MPRSARIDIPNLLQHVIVRGIEKRDIFNDDDDRRQFVKRFSNLLVSTETDCFAWALLDNHFHLLLRPRQIPLAQFMRRLLTGYAVTFNLRHRRSGHLFQNRYKSIVCDEEEYLLELVRYIHLNPLRAGLVPTIVELDRYLWCGHAVLLGKGDLPGQATAEVLARFGKSPRTSLRRYRSFVEDGIAMGGRSDLVGAGKQRRQPAPDHPEEREQRDSRVLGSGDFVEQLLLHTEAEPIPAKVPLEEIIARVREKFDLSLTELTSQTRAQRVANARSIICHLAFACGHRGVDIARRLGITGSGVTIAAQRGKKVISEDPGLFAMIDGLGWLRI